MKTAQNIDVVKSWISQTLDHDRPLTCCRFSPCGEYLVAGGQDERVVRWHLESGEKTMFAAHRSWVDALAFEAESKRLLSADFHGVIHCWPYDAKQPKPIWSRSPAHEGWVRALAVAAPNQLLSAGNDRVVRLWSIASSGDPLREFAGHKNQVFSLAVHPDGKSFCSGDLSGEVRHWELSTGKLIRTIDASQLHTRLDNFLADVGGARALAFDTEGKRLACSGMTDAKSNTFCPGKPAILVFDVQSGEQLQELRPLHASDGPIKGLTFLRDGTLAGHAEHLNGGSSLEFWGTEQTKSLHVIKRQSGYSLDLHPDGQRLATATFKNNGRGGNGRHSTPEEYATHHGEIVIYSLFEKPVATES